MRRCTFLGCFVCLSLMLSSLSAQESSVKPGINKSYEKLSSEKGVQRFERAERDVVKSLDAIVEACELKPGMDVADVGAGTGLFSRAFAKKIAPEGKLHAVDITRQFLEHIKTTADEQGLKNVVCLLCDPESTLLERESVDLVFVCDTYHHFEYPMKTLASIHQALRPGGRLIVIDFNKKKDANDKWVQGHVRADKQMATQEITDAGFKLLDEVDIVPTQWLLRFEKAERPKVKHTKGDEYFTLRSSLDNCRHRFTRDGEGRVAFLGGSITQMNGWRPMVSEALKKRFPDTKFDFVDAGISSTDSTLGPFRLESTVFSRGPVDLLFVEFAVNDHHNSRDPVARIRGMEGIIRQARAKNPAIDIVMLQCVEPDKIDVINAGRVPDEIASHERVAVAYRVPSIDFAREVTARINAGEITWKQFGGLHPAKFGHRLYTDSIERLFNTAWKEPLAEKSEIKPHTVLEIPLDPNNYEKARYVDLNEGQRVNGFKYVASWKASDKAGTRPRFVNVPMLEAIEPAALLKLHFRGTGVGLLTVAGPDVGILEFRIDDGAWREFDQFTRWSQGLHIPWAIMLDAEIPQGEHVLELRTTAKKHERSKGHAVRIVKFLVK